MSFNVGDRVTKDGSVGTVEAVFGGYVWVLADGIPTPFTFLEADIQPLVTPVFEVGKNYTFPGGDGTVFHVVHKIDDNNFVVYYTPPTGGYGVTIASPSQRALVKEV